MKMGPILLQKADYCALSAAFLSMPAPRITKDSKWIGKTRIESPKHVPVSAILHNMGRVNPEAERGERDSMLLSTALVLLDSIGAIEVTESKTVAAVTESAGYFLHSLGQYLRLCANRPDTYRPIHLDPSEEELCERPFLILARQAEEHRIAWAQENDQDIEPIRTKQNVSVVIRGERPILSKLSGNGKEAVYLHVWNEGQNAYTLIGSEKLGGESLKDTAYRALKEDLDFPRDEEVLQKIDLQPCGARDLAVEAYSPTHGAYTKYVFNLFFASIIDGELQVRGNLKPRWFTYEEISNQQSKTGEHIISDKYGVFGAVDLSIVPSVFTRVRPYAKPIGRQLEDLLIEVKDVKAPLGELASSIWSVVLSWKWYLLLIAILLLSALLMSPITDEKLPGLSNVADILGILGFIASLIGVAVRLQSAR